MSKKQDKKTRPSRLPTVEKKRVRLTDTEVEDIRDMYETGLFTYASLARAFGVSRTAVQDFVSLRRRPGTPRDW